MFKTYHNSPNSLEYQHSVHISLVHLLSNFQDAITPQNIAYIDNKRTFQVSQVSTHFIFAMNVRNNYGRPNKNKNNSKLSSDMVRSTNVKETSDNEQNS